MVILNGARRRCTPGPMLDCSEIMVNMVVWYHLMKIRNRFVLLTLQVASAFNYGLRLKFVLLRVSSYSWHGAYSSILLILCGWIVMLS